MLDRVTKGYLALRPAAAAHTLARLDDRDTKAIFETMPHRLAAKVLQHMAPRSAGWCLTQLPTKTGGEILARTPVLAAVAALRLMERDQVKELLAAMPRHAAARLWLRLRYSERVIGAFVDADAVTLTLDLRVSDALRLLRRAGRRTGHTIPVLNERRLLAGLVDLTDLIGARDRSAIQSLMRPASVALNARAALHTATNHPAWLTHDSLPVTNRDGVFQGVLERSRVMEEEQQLVAEVTDPISVLISAWKRLSPDIGMRAIDPLPDDHAAEVLGQMDPSRAAALLSMRDAEARERYLGRLTETKADELRTILAYPADSAGALMDPRVLLLRADTTVREALARIRALHRRGVRMLFVANAENRLEGQVDIQVIATATATTQLADIKRPVRAAVNAVAPREEVVEILDRYRLTDLPVVDGDERLIGVVRYWNGIAVAATTSLGVWIWSGSVGLAGVIGVSMILSMVIAGIFGAAIPLVLNSIGKDPAQSSSIVLTTVTDVAGFFSFLGIATLFSRFL